MTQTTFVVSMLATLAVATSTAFAQTPTIIRSCVTQTGTIRIISSSQACRSNETLLTWNQQGPTGPQGPQGPRGPSDAIFQQVNNYLSNVVSNQQWKEVAKLNIPSSTSAYAVTTQMTFTNSLSSPVNVQCRYTVSDFVNAPLSLPAAFTIQGTSTTTTILTAQIRELSGNISAYCLVSEETSDVAIIGTVSQVIQVANFTFQQGTVQ